MLARRDALIKLRRISPRRLALGIGLLVGAVSVLIASGSAAGAHFNYAAPRPLPAGSVSHAVHVAGPMGPGSTPTSTPTATCPPGYGTVGVTIENYSFLPQNITVTAGTNVRWSNYDGAIIHSSTSDTGIWDSGPLSNGQSFSFTFNSPGTYAYHCTVHPDTMHGTVTILAGCTPTPTATPGCTLGWGLVSSPNVGTRDNFLLDMAAVSANDIWAVGYYYNGFASQTLAEHWDGTQWSVVPSPNVGTGTSVLHGVAAVGSNDVWAVGYTGTQTLAEHWNGTQWTIVGSPNVGAGSNGLLGVMVVSANDIMGGGPLLRPGRRRVPHPHRALERGVLERGQQPQHRLG